MDTNDYRTQIITKAYDYSLLANTTNYSCENWTFEAEEGTLSLCHGELNILKVFNGDVFLNSTISMENQLPYFAKMWFF